MLFALPAPPAIAATAPAASPSPAPSPTNPAGSVADGGALISNSGSTNTLPYTIALRPDGSAVVTVGAATRRQSVPRADAAELFAELRDAMPLGGLTHAHCMRSASFGTSTTVTFGGEATPDLNCPGDPASRGLAAGVARVVDDLALDLWRVRHPVPLSS
jgi:hypothetical protein